jgi:hypothetical protein
MHTFCRSAAFALLLFSAPFAQAAKNPWVWPQSIVINFVHGNRAVFEIYDAKITKIVIFLGVTELSVPKDVVDKIQDVQFDSVHMVYPVGVDTLKPSDSFEVRFRVGPETRRSAGELPEITLTFHQAKFEGAAVTTRKGDSWQTADL